MVANTHDFFRATYWHYNFLSDRLKGTWLESHMNAPRLLVNLVSNDDFEQVLAKLRELDPNHAYNAQVFSDRVKAPNTLDQWLDEVMTTEPKDLTLSHFQIYHLERYELPEQILSTRWRPEAVIRHMLKGLELFVTQDCEQNLPKRQIDEQAFQGCVYVAKTLVSRYELDYKAFAGFGSLSVRALAEAGLDKRRLPRMNNRDKGILVLEEMGL
jgi:hypothetical protein